PSAIMGAALVERLGVPAADCLIAGDRPETDIAMGIATGMATALVLTGVTRPEGSEAVRPRPDFIVERLDQLLPDAAPAP
ncbi:MAG: HAD hydrolase-like protein, partial [bacterium]